MMRGNYKHPNNKLIISLLLFSTIILSPIATGQTTAPSTQATAITFANVQATQMDISFTSGDGQKRAVFVKEGIGPITNPTDNSTYVASADWGAKASQLETSGYYCVYNGSGNSLTLTGLTTSTQYTVQIFEYNDDGTSVLYLTSTAIGNPQSQTTLTNVSSVTLPPDGIYKTGDNLDFTVNFSSAVTITGSPYIPLTLNAGGPVQASYHAGSGTSAITFRYTILSGDLDNDGISIETNILINGGTIKDGSGNDAALTLGTLSSSGIKVDGVAPTTIISSTILSPTNSSSIPVTVAFSEAVTEFAAGGVSVTNGTAGMISGSGANYTFNVTPTGQGTVSVSILANVAHDAAGNGNTVSNSISIIYDNQAPSVNITSSASSSTNTSPIPVTVTFSETVTGFATGGVSVINGTAGTISGSGANYTFNVTPTGQGTVSVSILANVAQDAASNGNTASNTLSIAYDSHPPSVNITSSASSPTNTSPIPVTVTFSETVTGFATGDVSVTNGTAGSISGSGANYTFNVTPSGQGTVSVSIAANVTQDAASNGNTASNTLNIVYDSQAPSVNITSSASSPTNTSPIPVTIAFSEAVTGFTAGDVSVTNGTAGTISGSGANYTFNVTPAGQGTVTINIAANVAQDAAGNRNTASNTLNIVYDSQAPSVNITSSASSPTNTSPIPVTVAFSEAVTGFAAGDVSVINGTAGTISGNGATYTFNVTPAGQGSVSVSILANVAQDAAGNKNTASNTLNIVYDSQAPSVNITSSASSPTNTSPIPVTV
ncbi:MAG: Ig-like domain-containing protein, partial [Bacteroidota bacterium]|nr:Ig-like domain-containing protein [Bacteroidota bacterium]